MSSEPVRILLVEDNPGDARLIAEMLRGGGTLEIVDTLADAVTRLAMADIDVVLLDLGLADSQGLETFAKVRDAAPGIAVIVLTGNSDLEMAVRAVKEGAQDYLVKGRADGELLRRAIAYALGRLESEETVRRERALLARTEEIARLGSWRYDLATGTMWWSDEMYRVLGIDRSAPPEDLVTALQELVQSADLEIVPSMIALVGADGTSKSARHPTLTQDGTVRWIDTHGRQERDVRGEVVAIAGFAQDVTDEKLNEERAMRLAALDRAIAALSAAMVTADASIEELAELVLDDAKTLTDSPLGFLSSKDSGMSEAYYTNLPPTEAALLETLESGVAVSCLLTVPAIVDGSFAGQITVGNAPGGYTDEDLETVKRIAALYAIALVGQDKRNALMESESSLRQSNLRFERMVYGVAEAMGRIVEVRDPYTQGHEVRVAGLAKLIAEEMRLPEDDIEAIEMAGLVHDIGKLCVPAEILTKPGRLFEEEFALIKKHCEAGYSILKDIEFPWPVADIVLAHHERMDGSGYPRGLAGEAIPLASRVLAVADVVEAMASHRPYRPALGLDAAMTELATHPVLYDQDVVGALMALHGSGRVQLLPTE